MIFRRIVALAALLVAGCAGTVAPSDSIEPNRNVILFLGDGMSLSTITATRIFDGQSHGSSGEENSLSFEAFPHVALVKTYNTNQQVPDSAGTATAIHTGTKTRAGVINIGPAAHRRNCNEARANELRTLGEIVRSRGKSLGIVTTTRVTHATPATVYAQSAEREWESDAYFPDEAKASGCRDIAAQLLAMDPAQGPDIVLGGGLREFRGTALGGKRRVPNADLIADWLAASPRRKFIQSRAELSDLDPNDQVVGLFSASHMTYVAERNEPTREPTIQEMTAAAIDYLEARGEGYYLLVEGGRIDHGHHEGYPGYALLETQAFAEAVAVALGKVDLAETLILVTADHSHVFTLGGYPTRGNPVLELVVENDLSGEPQAGPYVAADGQPYTSVGYMNGPGAVKGPRRRPDTGVAAIAQALIPFQRTYIDGSVANDETHSGEDVPLYATGQGSERVGGVIEQNRIFDIMMAAFGWQVP